MIRKLCAGVAVVVVPLALSAVSAQELTLRGEVVEVSCFAKGVAESTGPGHVACAKECVSKKGQPLGILTDGDGLIKITGDYAANRYAKMVQYIGRQVEVRGTSDRFLDYSRAIKVTSVTPLKAASPK
jgi:hypothetical protein